MQRGRRARCWSLPCAEEPTLELPTGSRLLGEAGVATLRTSGTLGGCHYTADAGDIHVDLVAGRAELSTGMGAVRIERIGGSASVKDANADTWIGDVVGDLRVKAADNGSIAVHHAQVAVTAKTANGDIHLDEVARGVIVAQTSRGNVDVAVRAGFDARMDVHTGF